MMRTARLEDQASNINVIRRFLPSNYAAFTWGNNVIIEGEDVAGWTMDGYVIPRLASGNFYAKEI